MDLNLVVLSGRLACDPEIRAFDSGTHLVRYLVTVHSEDPRRRVDVVPVTHWNPPDEACRPGRGERIWVAGSVQRRFWEGAAGRRSRLEIVAGEVRESAAGDRPGGAD